MNPYQSPHAQPNPAYALLEQSLADWAAEQEDIRALVLIGSRARTVRPADGWSDLDGILLVDDTQIYCQPGEWQNALRAAFGQPTCFEALDLIDEETPDWEFLLQNGLKIDLTFCQNHSPLGRAATLAEISALCVVKDVFASGARVLADLTPGGTPLTIPDVPAPPPPAQAAFNLQVSNVLNELLRAARLCGRGELWRAAMALNQEMRAPLLRLLEWQAGQTRPGYGRFLETWADPRALTELPATYSDGTPAVTRRAIRASLELLGWLAPAAAARLGLAAPQENIQATAEWLHAALQAQEPPVRPEGE